MVKAVFTTKVNPVYDDLPEVRYHFPATYLKAVERAVNDQILYYEPRRKDGDLSSRGGRQAYFASAFVTGISKDLAIENHYYAHISDYLEFDRPVPFAEAGFYYENALEKNDGSTNKGAFGRAVRNLPDQEFDTVIGAGFAAILNDQASMTALGVPPSGGLQEEPGEFERPVVESILRRPFREAAFARIVKDKYAKTCALTGLRIINGGGRAEVQAAHIKPVADKGPDSVRNGLALCGTAHWMFDRGLISMDDDYRILKAKSKIPENVDRLLNPDGLLILPAEAEYRPHPQFMRYHRETIFKG